MTIVKTSTTKQTVHISEESSVAITQGSADISYQCLDESGHIHSVHLARLDKDLLFFSFLNNSKNQFTLTFSNNSEATIEKDINTSSHDISHVNKFKKWVEASILKLNISSDSLSLLDNKEDNSTHEIKKIYTHLMASLNTYFHNQLKDVQSKKKHVKSNTLSFKHNIFSLLINSTSSNKNQPIPVIGDDASPTQEKIEVISLLAKYTNTDYNEHDFQLYYTGKNCNIYDMCMHANLNIGAVELENKWWKSGGPPMIVFSKTDNKAYAVITMKHTNYYLIDLQKNQQIKITNKIAGNFKSKAFINTPSFRTIDDKKNITFKSIIQTVKSTRNHYLPTFILTVLLFSIIALIPAIISTKLINNTIPSGSMHELIEYAIIFITVALSLGALNLLKTIIYIRYVSTCIYILYNALINRSLQLPLSFFNKYSAGDLSTRTFHFIIFISNYLSAQTNFIFSMCYLIVSCILLFYYSAVLAGGVIIIAGILIIIYSLMTYLQLNYNIKQNALFGLCFGESQEIFENITQIILNNKQLAAIKNWINYYSKSRKNEYLSLRLSIIKTAISNASHTFFLITIFIMLQWVLQHKINIGSFVGFTIALAQFGVALNYLFNAITSTIVATTYYHRAKPIINSETEQQVISPLITDLKGNIKFKNIFFSYDQAGRGIINNISFNIDIGKTIVFTGKSGSGKTTIHRLLSALYFPTSGRILYDDISTEQMNVRAHWDQLGIITQSNNLILSSLLVNITLDCPFNEDDIWKILKTVRLDKAIQALPNKLNTTVFEIPHFLTDDVKQRILIARALIKQPKILLLDEPLKNLQYNDKVELYKIIQQMEATCIIMTNDFSLMKDANEFIVLDNGTIKEQGDFNTLMNKQGLLYKLHLAQNNLLI